MEQKRKHPATVAEMALRGIKEDVPLYKMIEIVKDALISYGFKDGPKEEPQTAPECAFHEGDFIVSSINIRQTSILICKEDGFSPASPNCKLVSHHALLMRSSYFANPYEVFLDGIYYVDTSETFRLATPEEKQLLLDELAKAGYRWDEENKKVVKNRWKPEMDETYYIPYCMGSGLSPYKTSAYEWKNDDLEVETWENGRIFQTKEECDAFCQKLNEAIRNVKRE